MNRQGVNGAGRNGVLPIFSRRKRPRQAIYADPSFSAGQSSTQQSHTGSDNHPTETKANSFIQYNNLSLKKNIGSSMGATTGQMQQSTNQARSSSSRQYAPPPLHHPRQQNQQQNKGIYHAAAQTVDTRQNQQLGNTLRNRSQEPVSSGTQRDRQLSQHNFTNSNYIQPKGILKQPLGLNNSQAANTHSAGQRPFRPQPGYQKQGVTNCQLTSNSTMAYEYSSTQAAVAHQNQWGSARQQLTDEHSMANTVTHNKVDHETDDIRIKPVADDKSMRILTATIEGMIHWKQSTKLNLLFEIYGVVDSAVLLSKDGCGREFNLRDGKQSIQCIFFEMDRAMPKVTRGQWYRCVGNLNASKPMFTCVAIRPATQQEKKLIKVNIAASDKAMREVTATNREP